MDTQRAQEIIDSPTMINVSYNGIPVYIKEVNNNMATVFPLDEMDNVQEVDVEGLIEGK
ncbi:small acid-soluble spore protein H (minor) [Evansella vedderi]|uniref:Small, acid-soluble spore protein H n=1 Tax=Evansella vedderi TaxID=38282 RepID=A0ABU0A0F4_9BACI|nr:H-type small acid-soluble spore protein [Evansella vedderi]MDQ0256971.1 small acid-soluble spore protein H (minor) [Evansella vedderi]